MADPTLSIVGAISVAVAKAYTTTELIAVTAITVATSGAGSVAATYSWSAGSGTLTVPMWANAAAYPYFGPVIVTATDGTLSPSNSTSLDLPSGYAAVTFASVAAIDSTYIGKYFSDLGIPLLDGDRCYYETTNNLVIAADSSIAIDALSAAQIVIHRAADFKTYTYTLLLGGGAISSLSAGVGVGV